VTWPQHRPRGASGRGGHGPPLGIVGRGPGWGLLSCSAAPLVLVGGWTLAARRQPPGYDAVRDTISALAARDATDRWLMTAALAGVGACHVATAWVLRPAARTGRVLLAAGGGATVAVALFPLPSAGGQSRAHSVAATLAFGALTLWPAAAAVSTIGPDGGGLGAAAAPPRRGDGDRGHGRPAGLVRS